MVAVTVIDVLSLKFIVTFRRYPAIGFVEIKKMHKLANKKKEKFLSFFLSFFLDTCLLVSYVKFLGYTEG